MGGEGFIGRNIASLLSEEWDCFSLGEKPSPFLERTDTFIQGDPYWEKIPNLYDVIVHLIDLKITEDELVHQEEKLVTHLELNPANHLVLFSSAVIYANPDSEYGRRKQVLEKFYQRVCQEKNIRLTIVRPFNLYGPFQIPFRQGSLIANLLYNHLEEKVTEINDMEAKRDFLFVGDLAQMVQRVIEQKLEGTYDIGSGKLTTIREVITILEEKVLKEKIQILEKKNKDTSKDQVAKGDLLEGLAVVNFEEGLGKTLDFYKENIPVIKRCTESGK